jgi:hypothetical protein
VGEAKRRKRLDQSYGQRCRLVVSEETGKWLVQTRVNVSGVIRWVSAVVYIDKADAEAALEQLKVLCEPYTVYEMVDSVFFDIIDKLPEDDDEVLWLCVDGEWHDKGSPLVKDKMALLAEHGELSDKLLESKRQR